MLPLDQPRRAPRLSQLLDVLRQDVRDEEDVLFPLLQENLHPRRLPWLGGQCEFAGPPDLADTAAPKGRPPGPDLSGSEWRAVRRR
jgi:hypothetical protein